MSDRRGYIIGIRVDPETEIAEWFTVWLQTPEIFDDWLELRRRSANFREQFEE